MNDPGVVVFDHRADIPRWPGYLGSHLPKRDYGQPACLRPVFACTTDAHTACLAFKTDGKLHLRVLPAGHTTTNYLHLP